MITAAAWSQASQVRKSNYVPEKGLAYDPDKNHTCTVYSGTMVQQVILHASCICTWTAHKACMSAGPLMSWAAFAVTQCKAIA